MKLNKKILSVMLSGIMMMFSIVGCSKQENVETKTESQEKVEVTTEKKEYRYEEYNEVLIDNEYVTLTLVAKAEDEYGFGYVLHAKNKTDKEINIGTDNMSINNQMVNGWGIFIDLMGNCESKYIYYISDWYVVDDYDDLTNVQIEWYLFDKDGYHIDNSQCTTHIK